MQKSLYRVLLLLAPWYVLVVGIYGLLVGLTSVNLSPFATSGGLVVGQNVFVSGMVLIVANVLLLIAFPKLRRLQKRGWVLFVSAQVINLVSSIVLFDLFRAIWDIVIIILLFRIAKYYK